MFQPANGSNRSCDGVSRRNLLRVGSLSTFGSALPDLLRAKTLVAAPGPDVSCMLVWLQGGVSHIDSFDPKPKALNEIRGEFRGIDTNVPGIQVCDPMPRLAAHQDMYPILRSLNPRNGSHDVADACMLTGPRSTKP